MFRLNCKMLYIFIFPLWSHLSKHTRTPTQLPTRYSNERTFLEWIHFATILAAAGLRIKLQINHKMPFSERCFSDQGNQLQICIYLYEMCFRSLCPVFRLLDDSQPSRGILMLHTTQEANSADVSHRFSLTGGGSCMFNFGIYWI